MHAMVDIQEQMARAARLVKARLKRGYTDAKAAAKRFGYNYDTYIQHERGERGIGRVAGTYARDFRVSKSWLLTGEGAESSTVPVVGIVGAGGDVAYDTALEGDTEPVTRPPGAPDETVAVEIRGDSLGPGFDRWYALYAQRHDPVTRDLVGHLCVVGTEDGRTLIKWVRLGRKGYNLQSGNGAIEENVRLAWGAKVIDLRPR